MGYCCGNMQEQVRPVTLILKRAELLYDAENYAYVEGDIMKSDNEHATHQVFDIGQDGNIDRVTRVLNLAHAECVEMLYPYTKKEVPNEQKPLDDILVAPEEYVIDLLLPDGDGFSITTVRLLEHLIHEYLVYRVLADWMSITNPGSQKNWEDKLANIKSRIQSALMSRRGRLRRKLTPF